MIDGIIATENEILKCFTNKSLENSFLPNPTGVYPKFLMNS